MTGCNGGNLSKLSDVALRSNERETYLIQQEHIAMYHALCAAVEEEFV
jgi:phosphoheptose isomerase